MVGDDVDGPLDGVSILIAQVGYVLQFNICDDFLPGGRINIKDLF